MGVIYLHNRLIAYSTTWKEKCPLGDLVISAYKPTTKSSKQFHLGVSSIKEAWVFVEERLQALPVFVEQNGQAEVIIERTAHKLFDRMTAFHVKHGLAVPLSAADFFSAISQRFSERDGMYFLPDQVIEYDQKRRAVSELGQLNLMVADKLNSTN